MVPSSIVGPERVKIFAWVMAYVGDLSCALAASEKRRRFRRQRRQRRQRKLRDEIDRVFTPHLRKRRRLAAAWVFLPAFSLRVSSLPSFFRQAFWRLRRLRAFSRSSFLFRAALSFLFRGRDGRRYRAGGRSKRGHRSGFFGPRRKR